MSSARFTRRCFLAGAALGTAVKAGDPQPIGELVGGMAELVKLQRLPRVASNIAPSEFPQTDDVWQADFFHSPTFISNDDVGVECVMADELPELHDFCRMLASDEISGLSVIYDEVAVMAPADLYLVERNGWPVPTPEAYPVALRFEPGRQPQSPRDRTWSTSTAVCRSFRTLSAAAWIRRRAKWRPTANASSCGYPGPRRRRLEHPLEASAKTGNNVPG